MNPLIQHLLVTTQPQFTPRGNVVNGVRYSYYIGEHGPFFDDFVKGEDTVAAVQAAMQANIEKLAAVGAIPPQV